MYERVRNLTKRDVDRIELAEACLEAVTNTADRLDPPIDPVALAEACRDGEFLEVALGKFEELHDAINEIAKAYPRHREFQRKCAEAMAVQKSWMDKLAALKRQEG